LKLHVGRTLFSYFLRIGPFLLKLHYFKVLSLDFPLLLHSRLSPLNNYRPLLVAFDVISVLELLSLEL
jgi:hypothetical protein